MIPSVRLSQCQTKPKKKDGHKQEDSRFPKRAHSPKLNTLPETGFSQSSPDRGQFRKIRCSTFPGSGSNNMPVNSVFCCCSREKINTMLPNLQFSKPIFGQSARSTKLDRPSCKQAPLQTVRFSPTTSTRSSSERPSSNPYHRPQKQYIHKKLRC